MAGTLTPYLVNDLCTASSAGALFIAMSVGTFTVSQKDSSVEALQVTTTWMAAASTKRDLVASIYSKHQFQMFCLAKAFVAEQSLPLHLR